MDGRAVVEVGAGSLASVPVHLVIDGERAANRATGGVRFGLRSVSPVGAEGGATAEGAGRDGVVIDEASRFYLPPRSDR